MSGLERWKKRHPEVMPYLEPSDVLVDAMRGKYSVWTRVRVNLEHVPKKHQPEQEALDPDEDVNDWPKGDWPEGERPGGATTGRRRPSRARTES